GIPVAWLCMELPPAPALVALAADGYWGVHPHVGGLSGVDVEAAHSAGLAVVSWAVNEADHAGVLAGAGIDAVITDTPLLLRQRLGG
ncbi:MAG: glycerophosphodiester phosphodiesterase family protein, partial [Acidimicrobiales bacterium]